jgi:hypothetical protein
MNKVSAGNYVLVTLAYWGFTLTDGALRMLVLLHFNQLGYNPIQLAFMFLLYEFFGMVTNLLGGWIAAQLGLRVTLFAGLALQVLALVLLALLDPGWSGFIAVSYVMAAQALSGIAKDLTKMSAKSAIKLVVPDGAHNRLFKWVAILTGSKNALKGAGFFMGAALLAALGFASSLYAMAAGLFVILLTMVGSLPASMGMASRKPKFTHLLSKSRSINLLSAARLFLFGSRDIWFVVGLPLFLASQLGWSHPQVGGYMALWVIGYGIVQSLAPGLLRRTTAPTSSTALGWVLLLCLVPLLIIAGLYTELSSAWLVTAGLAVYGIVFAVNSSVHSYLILAYSQDEDVTMDVGFYYMANAGGRLLGTLLSGIAYQWGDLQGCLLLSLAFLVIASIYSRRLRRHDQASA